MPCKPTTIDVPAGDGLLSRWWFGPKPTGEVYADLIDGPAVFDEGAYPVIAGATLEEHAAHYLESLKADARHKSEKIAAKLAKAGRAAAAAAGRDRDADSVPSNLAVPS